MYRPSVVQQRVSKVWSSMAPVGGINDSQPLAAMDPKYCLEMLNWFPGDNALSVRRGYREWVTNLGAPVESIMTYFDMSGELSIFATTNAGIYDVTTQTDTPVLSFAITDGDYKSIMFGTVANQYLVAVNGKTSPSALYDGTSWVNMVQSDTPAAPGEIKGVDPNVFSHVTAFKRRLWFVEADSTTAWYLPIDSVGGEAKPFQLASIFRLGGKLLYIIDWSVDAGDGLDDKIVFVSNLGEIAVYAGDDPDIAEAWQLQAVFYSAAPMGDRTYVDLGGDVVFLTAFGVLQLSAILIGKVEQTPEESSLSKNVNRTLNAIARSGAYQLNWQLYNVQNIQALFVNIPKNDMNPSQQYVMNLLNGSWTKYDLPMLCAELVRGNVYFGTEDGRVCEFGGETYLDNVKLDGTGGDRIPCEIFTAFSYMDNPSAIKHWKLIRLLFQATKPPNYIFKLNTDFSLEGATGAPSPPIDAQDLVSLWDEAIWDQNLWEQPDKVYRPWLGVSAMGFACALLLKSVAVARTTLTAIDYVYEEGGII